jgi:hypothetical protein
VTGIVGLVMVGRLLRLDVLSVISDAVVGEAVAVSLDLVLLRLDPLGIVVVVVVVVVVTVVVGSCGKSDDDLFFLANRDFFVFLGDAEFGEWNGGSIMLEGCSRSFLRRWLLSFNELLYCW